MSRVTRLPERRTTTNRKNSTARGALAIFSMERLQTDRRSATKVFDAIVAYGLQKHRVSRADWLSGTVAIRVPFDQLAKATGFDIGFIRANVFYLHAIAGYIRTVDDKTMSRDSVCVELVLPAGAEVA